MQPDRRRRRRRRQSSSWRGSSARRTSSAPTTPTRSTRSARSPGGGGETVVEAVGRVGGPRDGVRRDAPRRRRRSRAGLPAPDKVMALSPLRLVAEERTLKGSYMGSGVPRRDVPRAAGPGPGRPAPDRSPRSGTLRLDGDQRRVRPPRRRHGRPPAADLRRSQAVARQVAVGPSRASVPRRRRGVSGRCRRTRSDYRRRASTSVSARCRLRHHGGAGGRGPTPRPIGDCLVWYSVDADRLFIGSDGTRPRSLDRYGRRLAPASASEPLDAGAARSSDRASSCRSLGRDRPFSSTPAPGTSR